MADEVLKRHKRPGEKFRMSWDFSKDLESGDSVASQSITATQLDTGADVTATFLEGAMFAGNVLKVTLKDGIDGKDYDVALQATTSQGDIFLRIVRVNVRNRP